MAKTMQAEIITIGDELLIGQVVDTNSAWMAQRLNERGIELKQITSVHDDALHIVEALDAAFSRADIVITTGGLGPTKDDITKHVLCDYFHTRLIENTEVHRHVLNLYKDRPQVFNRLTETQWLVPETAHILPNRVGSAPLMVFERCAADGRHQWLFSLPGVPYEMQIAMDEQIGPYILAHCTASVKASIVHRTVLTYGMPESALALRIESWENALPDTMHLAYLPKDGMVRLRLSGYNVTEEAVDSQIKTLLPLIQDYVVATEDQPLEVLVGRALLRCGRTIATAESCTGGRLASLLNAHSGSSAFYFGSVVAYDNSVKRNVLSVPAEDLDRYGAVSEQVVRKMAEGARRVCGTDYAIATSGVAGPIGGTPDKPVGTVWIAWAMPDRTEAEVFRLGRLREQITARACQVALIKLLKYLQE